MGRQASCSRVMTESASVLCCAQTPFALFRSIFPLIDKSSSFLGIGEHEEHDKLDHPFWADNFLLSGLTEMLRGYLGS